MYRFLLVDDHRLFLEGMQHILKELPEGISIQTSDTVAGALNYFDKGDKFDLLMLDISLPDMNGFSLIQSLNERGIILPIVIVSSSSDLNEIRKCFELGASGFINKNASSAEMLSSVRKVLRGDLALPENLATSIEFVFQEPKKQQVMAPQKAHQIRERQIEVLHLIDQGMSNKQVAKVLAISEATVKYHVGILFKQLGAKNRTTCIRKAKERGYLLEAN